VQQSTYSLRRGLSFFSEERKVAMVPDKSNSETHGVSAENICGRFKLTTLAQAPGLDKQMFATFQMPTCRECLTDDPFGALSSMVDLPPKNNLGANI
jgi:hypothetical protein